MDEISRLKASLGGGQIRRHALPPYLTSLGDGSCIFKALGTSQIRLWSCLQPLVDAVVQPAARSVMTQERLLLSSSAIC